MDGDRFEDGASAGASEAIDLVGLSRALWRRRRWIAAPTIAAFIAASVFVIVVSPRYTGVAKVLLENQESYFTRPDKATSDPAANYDEEGVQSQAETVATIALARQAVDKLDLTERAEFNGRLSPSPFAFALSLIGGGRGDPNATRDRAADAFLDRLTVFPVAKSRVLQIEFVSVDPALAARGANMVAELYLAQQEEAKRVEARDASAWLTQKIEELRGKVAEADAKVEAFRAASGLFAGPNGVTVPAQQLADLNTQLAAARAAEADAAARAQTLNAMARQGRLDEIPEAARDDSLRRYLEQRVSLKAQIALESRTLLPQHPRMKELNAELAELEGQIRVAAAKAAIALQDQARMAQAQVDNLAAAIAKQSQTVAAGDVDDVRLRALDLDAKTTRDQLESYLEKNREAIAREAATAVPADARIIAGAVEPRAPTFPKKVPTVLLATLAGLLVSLGVVAAHALVTDGSGRGSDEAGREVEPAAAETKPAREASSVDLADAFASPEALADALVEAAPDDGAALTALIAGEDTDRALNLALTVGRALAERGRAALIDLGVSQEWLADVVDHRGESGPALAGLAELLAGRANFEAALHRDLSSRLDIVPIGTGEVDCAALGEALAAFAASYDFVVLHASDWRSKEVAAALPATAALVVAAPAARLRAALRRAREAFEGAAFATVGLASGEATPAAAIEKAA
jgi:uncharacterized protein involved in exopolysaccharide biosynthesis